MKIEIKTHLHEGIYKSSGGGQTRIIYSLEAGRATWSKRWR